MLTADAVRYFGSKVAIARELDIVKTAVSKWGTSVPPLAAARLAALTKGRRRNGVRLRFDPWARCYWGHYGPKRQGKGGKV